MNDNQRNQSDLSSIVIAALLFALAVVVCLFPVFFMEAM